MKEIDLYSFVYKGVLTEEALDRVGRRRRNHFGADGAKDIQKSLSYDFLDPDLLVDAQRMAFVYAAVHAFENTVRQMTTKAMAEAHGEAWWDKVPERIRKSSKTRMEEDAKSRWHGARGTQEINYCDFSGALAKEDVERIGMNIRDWIRQAG